MNKERGNVIKVINVYYRDILIKNVLFLFDGMLTESNPQKLHVKGLYFVLFAVFVAGSGHEHH